MKPSFVTSEANHKDMLKLSLSGSQHHVDHEVIHDYQNCGKIRRRVATPTEMSDKQLVPNSQGISNVNDSISPHQLANGSSHNSNEKSLTVSKKIHI